MNIERVSIDLVQPWEKNPRGIKTKDYARLKKQIAELGVYKPLIAYRENGHYVVLGGNMRIRALKEMGRKEVDVSVVDAPTEAKKIEYALSDNDRAGFYEEDKLAELVYPHIGELDLGEFKVDLGEPLDLKGVVERFGPDIDDGADNVPEVDDRPAVTKTGDLFTLGKHRLLCGDSTKAEDVAQLLGNANPLLCVTDPPYGVNYDPAWRNVEAEKGNLAYAAKRICPVMNDDRADWSAAWQLFPGDVIYSWHPAGATSLIHAKALQDSGFVLRMQIIWAKSNFPIGRGDYHVRHEPCWYAVREGKASRRTDDRTQTTLWEINLDKNVEGGHSTQKPVECMARPIRNHNFTEVYDPFLGSGTTLIAAEKTGRVCYGMEIDPKYCDVIIKRYADYTGTSDDAIRATRENPNG